MEEIKKKMSRRKKSMIIVSILSAIILTITILLVVYIDDTNVMYEDYTLTAGDSGSEITIAHLSDLHFPKIKIDTDELIRVIAEKDVDFIAITGDIIDGTSELYSSGMLPFIEKLVDVAPVYYVIGNHEIGHSQLEELKVEMDKLGVISLYNESDDIVIDGKAVTVVGLVDNANYSPIYLGEKPVIDSYKILLAHRPEENKTDSYVNVESDDLLWSRPDLILTGHAHGGQFRIAGQGLVAPNQGMFPKHDGGLYKLTDKSTMILSRGIGNSIIPFRFNNRPHVPIIKINL